MSARMCCWLPLLAIAGCIPFVIPAGAQIGLAPTLSQRQSTQSPTIAPHTVSGQVVNSITGQGIPRALVQLNGSQGTLTDGEGRFEFRDVAEPSVSAYASKPGYLRARDAWLGKGAGQGLGGLATAAAAAGGNAAAGDDGPIELRLTPEAILSGTVTDANGAPLENLPVTLRTLNVRNGLRHWEQRQGTSTNAEGEFRFAELEAGKYAVATGFHTDGIPGTASSVAYVPTDYPPVGGSGDAGAITLANGGHSEVSLSPPAERLYPVTGTIEGGKNGVSLTVETSTGQNLNPFLRMDGQTGGFRMLLPSGSYRLQGRGFAMPAQLMGTRSITVAHAPLRGVNLTLEPLASIPVEIRTEAVANVAGQGAGGGIQYGRTSAPHPYLSLVRADEDSRNEMYSAQPPQRGAGEGDGRLTIEGVTPGHYMLQAGASGQWYVASARCGNTDLSHETLPVSGGGAPCTIEVTVRDDPATLRCSVRGESNSGGRGFVQVVPMGDLLRGEYMMMPQEGGSGSISGIAPGRYLVIAGDHQQELPYRDPDAMRAYAAEGQEVTLAPGGTGEVEVELRKDEP